MAGSQLITVLLFIGNENSDKSHSGARAGKNLRGHSRREKGLDSVHVSLPGEDRSVATYRP
jgi:hypothetical protein